MGFLTYGIFNTWLSFIFSSFPYCKTVFLRPSNTVKLYFSSPLPLPLPKCVGNVSEMCRKCVENVSNMCRKCVGNVSKMCRKSGHADHVLKT